MKWLNGLAQHLYILTEMFSEVIYAGREYNEKFKFTKQWAREWYVFFSVFDIPLPFLTYKQ